MKYGRILTLMLAIILAAFWVPGVSASDEVSGSASSSLGLGLEIPLDKDQAPDVLVAGHSWERARLNLENPGTETLNNITVFIEVPEGLETSIPSQPYQIKIEGQQITAEIGELASGQSASLLLDIKPPVSVEFKKEATFTIKAIYSGGEQQSKHTVSLIPPPS